MDAVITTVVVLLIVLGMGLVTWYARQWRIRERTRLRDQHAANAAALHQLAADQRRRTNYERDDEDRSRSDHPRRSSSNTTQRRDR